MSADAVTVLVEFPAGAMRVPAAIEPTMWTGQGEPPAPRLRPCAQDGWAFKFDGARWSATKH